MKDKKIIPLVRINTRIKRDQQKYIKSEAKKTNATEGEVFRAIIDRDMIAKNK